MASSCGVKEGQPAASECGFGMNVVDRAADWGGLYINLALSLPLGFGHARERSWQGDFKLLCKT